MAMFGNSTDKAAAELRKLVEARSKLEGRAVAMAAELRELQATATEVAIAALDGGAEALQAKQARYRAETLRDELASFPTLRKELSRRIREAIQFVAKARADVLRRDVTKKEKALGEYAG